jgi:hypothetical protein
MFLGKNLKNLKEVLYLVGDENKQYKKGSTISFIHDRDLKPTLGVVEKLFTIGTSEIIIFLKNKDFVDIIKLQKSVKIVVE